MKALLPALVLATSLSAADWPRFLGPEGAAVSDTAQVPLTWSDTENLRWKIETPGPGSSSPIVKGDKIFLTCWSGYGDREGANDPTKLQRHLLCYELASGKKLWEQVVPSKVEEDPWGGMLSEHGYATHTPVADDERVYVFFGKTGALAFDHSGKQLWHTPLGTESGRNRWGSGGSPILWGDLVIINAADESRALVALDKKTGKQVWKADGDAIGMAYGTPSVLTTDGRTDLVFALAEEVWGLNPETGKLRWFATHKLPGNVSPVIVSDGRTAYLFGGYPTQGSVAVKLGGKGDVTAENILWSTNSSSYVPTPVSPSASMPPPARKSTASASSTAAAVAVAANPFMPRPCASVTASTASRAAAAPTCWRPVPSSKSSLTTSSPLTTPSSTAPRPFSATACCCAATRRCIGLGGRNEG